MYCVCTVEREHTVEAASYGIRHEIRLTWFDGMIGVMPVFADKKEAELYADGKFEIIAIEVTKPKILD